MDKYKENWLPHLKDAIPERALGDKVSMYSIALEGWRRGLTLKFRQIYNKRERQIKLIYSLSHKGKKHKFSVSRGDMVSEEAIKICVNKDLTKEYLLNANVPTPKGKGFKAEVSDDEIIEYANSFGFPLVLKPTDGLSGYGVIVNIKSITEFKQALKYVRHELNYKNVVVERHVQGEDCRVYVVNDKVIGAAQRIPANITGDGKHNIKQLIELKNMDRSNNPNYYKRPIEIDNELVQNISSLGYKLESIPKKDERIYIKKTSNISAGGDPIDVTNELTEGVKNTAVNAAQAIPELKQCAVDMLIDKTNNKGTVIEINSKPQIGLHLFPEEGKARDIPKAIIDFYFPETISVKKNSVFYFDFDSFQQLLSSKAAAKEVMVKKIPQYTPYVKKIELYGDVQNVEYRNWLVKQAHSFKLNGFIKNNVKEKSVIIVVAGEKVNVENFKKTINLNTHGQANVKDIKESDWKKPIKIGFEVIKSSNDNLSLVQRVLRKFKGWI